MAHLSGQRIDLRSHLALGCFMRCSLILPLFVLAACATFPQVDAAASKSIGARPAFLTLGQMNALGGKGGTDGASEVTSTDDLRTRATDLRAR